MLMMQSIGKVLGSRLRTTIFVGRCIVTCFLLYLVYGETGPYTTFSLGLIFMAVEVIWYLLRRRLY